MDFVMSELNPLAPIVLFCFNRPKHTESVLSALSKNQLAAESDLYIFCDGPRTEADIPAISEVHAVVERAHGFRNVYILKSILNKGLANSVIDGVTEIIQLHGRVIVLEDDLLTSTYFLKYMNDALEFYKDEEQVISIHGYIYPVISELPETFFLRGADCWGWATWKRGWDVFEADGQKLLGELKRRNLERRFDINGAYNFTKMLKDQIAGRNNSWAIRWYASALLKNKLTLYPGRSLVLNIGNDNSGTHCEADDVFDAQISKTEVPVHEIPIMEHPDCLSKFEKYLKSVRRRKIVNFTMERLKKIFPLGGN
jgi:hypothetical protein